MPYKDLEKRRESARRNTAAYRLRHRGRAFIGDPKPAPLCICGCGQPARCYVNPDGTKQAYRKFADGCAPYEKNPPKVPEDVAAIAYAAGIIDGEGCIQSSIKLRNEKLSNVVKVSVTMCSSRVPKWLQVTFGGNLRRYKGSGNNPRLRDVWELSGRKAEPFLAAIAPYLQEKQEQAKVALELIELIGRWGGNLRRTPEDEVQRRIQLSGELKRLKVDGMNPIQIQ